MRRLLADRLAILTGIIAILMAALFALRRGGI
jgi:hypothetical protein